MNPWTRENGRCQAIAASAGSGKTYRLAHRIIGLLACGVSPERIIALTFSRKAAGEILDDLMLYLREGAVDPDAAGRHAANAFCTARQDDFLGMLRAMVDALPRLKLQTLDSFTVGTVRSFPFELGLSGDPQIIDTNEAVLRRIQDRVFYEMIEAAGADPHAASAFGRDFRLATAAAERKGVRDILDEIIRDNQQAYQELPDAAAWGEPATIWGGPLPYSPCQDAPGTAARLLSLMDNRDVGHKSAQKGLVKTVETLGQLTYGAEWKPGTVEKLLLEPETFRLLRSGSPACIRYYNRDIGFGEEESSLLGTLLENALFLEYTLALQRTQGIYRLIQRYEADYDRAIRRRGLLTFTDTQLLLSPRYGADLATRLDVDYRLDARLDHWLLDEFQDTSTLQWEVIANLVDEVISDTDARKSFFYVGDVKQAIYQWRRGNPRLFQQLLNRYGRVMDLAELPVCRRQSLSVIQTVNQVFDALGSIPELPEEAVQRWCSVWREHHARPAAPEGYAALYEVPRQEGANGNEVTLPCVADLVRRIQPMERGLTVAILVRSNRFGEKVVAYLREATPEIDVVLEGQSEIGDSTGVRLLLSLLKVAAHPGDSLAWMHLKMSPIWADLVDLSLSDPSAFSVSVLGDVAYNGFQDVVRRWARRILRRIPGAAHDRRRLENLGEAAAAFDRTDEHSVAGFLDYVEGFRVSESAKSTAVRVMTVHQSKGLGFDVVVLPELVTHTGLTKATNMKFLADPHGSWLLKVRRRETVEAEPVFSRALMHADAEACFEAFCILYVAMTRSKQALYMVVPEPGPSSQSVSFRTMLQATLADLRPENDTTMEPMRLLYEAGNPGWYEDMSTTGMQATASWIDLPGDFAERKPDRARWDRIAPSEESSPEVDAANLFSEVRRSTMRVGRCLHRVLEGVAWDSSTIVAAWSRLQETDPGLVQDVVDRVGAHVQSLTRSDEVKSLLQRPLSDTVLWREKPFEAILDCGWVSGVFDRVVIDSDPSGKTVAAHIVDFKTDDLSTVSAAHRAEHHRPQLELYRRVLAKMLQLPQSRIALTIVFTATGECVSL